MPALASPPKARCTALNDALAAAGFPERDRIEVVLTCNASPYANDGELLTKEGLDEVKQLRSLCVVAKAPERFLNFYRAGKSSKEAGAVLLEAMAAASDALPTDNHPPAYRNPVDTQAAEIWKHRKGEQ